jgi:hypothetical protein
MGNCALTKAENEIFARYQALHPGVPILPDGAPDPSAYVKRGNFRVLFLLKEGNDPDGTWVRNGGDLRDMARCGGRYASWHNLATWIAISQRLPFTKNDRKSRDWRASQLRRAVFVNAKKIPGNANSSTTAIAEFALNADHNPLLKQQLELYRPRLTLACGNGLFQILRETFNARPLKPANGKYGYWFFKSKSMGTVIDFYHPEARQVGGWPELAAMVTENLRRHFPERYS